MSRDTERHWLEGLDERTEQERELATVTQMEKQWRAEALDAEAALRDTAAKLREAEKFIADMDMSYRYQERLAAVSRPEKSTDE